MNIKYLYYESLLLTTAIIWGFTFSLQKIATFSLPPFLFNSVTFFIAAISMLLLSIIYRSFKLILDKKTALLGLTLGLTLYMGNGLQQIGLSFTTATNSGFITTIYVILIPILTHFGGRRLNKHSWLAAFLALIGLFLISGASFGTVNLGDFLTLLSAFFCALHIILIDKFTKHSPLIAINFWQVLSCSALSFCSVILFNEPINAAAISASWLLLSFVGVVSMSASLLLQMAAQEKVTALHAGVILSLESLFAAIFGYLLLNELFNLKNITGAFIIFIAVIYSQIATKKD